MKSKKRLNQFANDVALSVRTIAEVWIPTFRSDGKLTGRSGGDETSLPCTLLGWLGRLFSLDIQFEIDFDAECEECPE